jgi:hypothetical protein
MCDNGTGQQVAQLHDSYMMMMKLYKIIKYVFYNNNQFRKVQVCTLWVISRDQHDIKDMLNEKKTCRLKWLGHIFTKHGLKGEYKKINGKGYNESA